jgi:hypothetical protein
LERPVLKAYAVEQPDAQARSIADGLKLALRELAEQEPETLRKFLLAVFDHLSDGASKWAGRKLLTAVGAALFAAAIWMVSRKW